MKILITGISGFVAKHFVEYLSTLKEDVEVFGLYNQNKPVFPESCCPNIRKTFFQVNMMDKEALRAVMVKCEPDRVLHLASKSSIAYSWLHPGEVVMENTGTFLPQCHWYQPRVRYMVKGLQESR